MKKILLAIALLGSQVAQAKVTLPSLLSDNAVLQQQSKVMLWGKSTGKRVRITPSWSESSYTAKVDRDGKWQIEVQTPEASYDHSITFDDGDELTTRNILIGEVWFCSGQSNMKVPMKGNISEPVTGAAQVILSAKSSTPIRLFTVPERYSYEPQEDCGGEWQLYTSENVANFGATPLLYARYIQQMLGIPVGVVNCSWGGSKIETWIPREELSSFKEYDFSVIDEQKEPKMPQLEPSVVFNGMMNAMQNLRFKGMIWYQGESNKKNYTEYPALFEIFTDYIRTKHFDCGTFPIYYVQIAPYGFGPEGSGVLMRETQTKIMERVERTGMATITDAGDYSCIHPPKKMITAERLAYWALSDTYGYKGIEYRAPEFRDFTHRKAAGKLPNRVALRFNYAEQGISLKGETSSNFEVAGADRKFYPAQVRMISKNKYPIELWSDKVEKIEAVRFGWRNYFESDLFNNYGVPVGSFRSDDWDF